MFFFAFLICHPPPTTMARTSASTTPTKSFWWRAFYLTKQSNLHISFNVKFSSLEQTCDKFYLKYMYLHVQYIRVICRCLVSDACYNTRCVFVCIVSYRSSRYAVCVCKRIGSSHRTKLGAKSCKDTHRKHSYKRSFSLARTHTRTYMHTYKPNQMERNTSEKKQAHDCF